MSFSWARLGTWIIALVVGAVYGVAGTIAHAYTLGWLPLGLLLALIGSTALLISVRALTGDRWAVLTTGIGMVLAVVLFSGSGPGGSIVVPGGDLDKLGPINLGSVWMFAVPLIAALVVVWPRRRSSAAADEE